MPVSTVADTCGRGYAGGRTVHFADEGDLGNIWSREHNHIVEQIRPQLLYQRLRNRVIELMEMHSAAYDIFMKRGRFSEDEEEALPM